MKTKLCIISAILGAVLCACKHATVSVEQDRNIINAIFQSAHLTPEQFADHISGYGFHEVARYDFMSYISFCNVDLSSNYLTDNKISISITYKNDSIQQIVYERYINGNPNPAAHYKLFSDWIADIGYENWHGNYEDPTEHDIINSVIRNSNYNSANIAASRMDLCNHINNNNLWQLNTLQYFVESFSYRHKDNSLWNGQSILYTQQYFSGETEDSGKENKDIILSVQLNRLK